MKTLSNLLFFYTDINNYLNLTTKFLLTCGPNGAYRAYPIPKKYLFMTNVKFLKVLEDCKKNRNANWKKSCRLIYT